MYKRYLNQNQPSTVSGAVNNEVLRIVRECWDIIEEQCHQYTDRQKNVGVEMSTDWRTVRVFVSSTFTDFFNEREILVKKVFPELREWCEERKLQLLECDLRWGVPKDFTDVETVCTCMEELDRCHDETDGKPFFINMIGEKYGWIPTADIVTDDMKRDYQWVPNTSITFMEILHGAYRKRNLNAVFFLRDPKVCQSIPSDFEAKFVDSSDLGREHLKELKKRLKQSFPQQVFEYSCTFEGLAEDTGRKMVKLGGLDNFAAKTLGFLKEAIKRTYPDVRDGLIQSEEDIEMEQQNLYMEKKSEIVIGRDDVVKMMLEYAKGNLHGNIYHSEETKAFVRDVDFWKPQADDNMILCLTGAVGFGKSTVMAKVVKEAIKDGINVFYHFVGCTGKSLHTENLCRRLAQAVTGQNVVVPGDERDPLKFCMEKIKESFESHRKDKPQLLLVIDGVNELADRNAYSHLSWLPPSWPGNIRCIVSTANDHLPTLHRIKEHNCFMVELSSLKQGDAENIIKTNLQQFSKKLDKEQLNMITSTSCAHNPLWLWLLTEQLRVFGDFRTLNQKIQKISESVSSLLTDSIERLIRDDDTGCMKKALCLIGISNGGIPSSDMQNILGNVEKKEPLPALYWAKIRRMLKPYIRTVGHREYLTFSHSAILQEVKDMLLTSKEDTKSWHVSLANYYLSWCEDIQVKIDNIPYHCREGRLNDKLIDFIHHSEAAVRIPDFLRSKFLQVTRCKQMADPVLPMIMPAIICRACSTLQLGFSPKHFPLNKDSCIICGTHVIDREIKYGFLCPRHSMGQSKLIGKCILCNMVVRKDQNGKVADFQGMQGKLCRYCSFGHSGKLCCHLES